MEECLKSIEQDANLMEDSNDCLFISSSLSFYKDKFIERATLKLLNSLPWKLMNENGSLNDFSHLEFWQEVVRKGTSLHNAKLVHLVKASSMLLAQPAGESVDESTFSSVGNTMRKDRSRLSPTKIEQITVIRMFIRNFKWNPQQLHQWFDNQLENYKI